MLKQRTRIILVALVAVQQALAASPKHAEPRLKEAAPGLRAKAKVTPEAARKAALQRAPGKVQSEELEEENGKLIYSFDIKAPHKSGIEEVQVDALTGEVLSVEHEDAKAEAQERKADEQAAPKPGKE